MTGGRLAAGLDPSRTAGLAPAETFSVRTAQILQTSQNSA
jgi:hypothetical protein